MKGNPEVAGNSTIGDGGGLTGWRTVEALQPFLTEDGRLSVPVLIGLMCLAGAILLAVFALLMSGRKTNGRGDARGQIGRIIRRNGTTTTGRFWQKIYVWLSGKRLTRHMLAVIRNRLELSTGFDERSLRKLSARIFLLTGGLMLLLMGVFIWLARDLLLCVIFAAMLGFLADSVLDIVVTRVGNRLLLQQIRFHEQLRHRYYEEKSVDGAVESACEAMRDEKAHDMFVQGELLLDMLTAPDTEIAFETYRQTAPNRYLKLLAGMCAITREYGDAQVDGGSVFLKGLGHLSEEIRSELFKRERLTYALRSLGVLTLLPLFFLRPIRQWASERFIPMEQFYAQGIGTLLELLMISIALACHACIRSLQPQGEALPVRRGKRTWEAELSESFLHMVISRLTPERYTVRHEKMVLLIKRAVSPLQVRELVSRQLVFAFAGFFCMLTLVGFLHVQRTHQILHEPDLPVGFLGGKLSEEDAMLLEKALEADRNLILSLPEEAGQDEVDAILAESGMPETERAAAAERIEAKRKAMRENRFWWWELALCLLAAAAGWQVPELFLRYQANVRALDMEDEVARFQSIILMLMHMPRMDVEEILNWMEMFSLHFRESLQTCLSDYSAGAVEALETLRMKIPFEPMSALVGDLILAASDLPILQAFEELESEKQWSREKRKLLNEQVVDRKRNLGNLIGFLPLYSLIGLYLMVPMVVASMTEMERFYQQMSSF